MEIKNAEVIVDVPSKFSLNPKVMVAAVAGAAVVAVAAVVVSEVRVRREKAKNEIEVVEVPTNA